MEREIVIKAENVTKKFGERQILSGINLEIYKGETFVIMGGSVFGFEEKGEIEKDAEEKGEFADNKNYYWDINAFALSDTDPNLIGINVVSLAVYHGNTPPLDKYFIFTYLNNKKVQ